jgi:hypothetical protein
MSFEINDPDSTTLMHIYYSEINQNMKGFSRIVNN